MSRINFKVFEHGGTAKSPIILFHESLGSVEQWKDFPSLLSMATGRKCIAYDRLGHGHSDPKVSEPTVNFIEEEADIWLPQLLETAGITDFVAYGHIVLVVPSLQ